MRFRKLKWFILALCLVVPGLFLLPQTMAATPGISCNNFFNVIIQNGADPWMYKHSNGWYYYTMTTGNNVTLWRSQTITGIDSGESRVVWTPPASGAYSKEIWAPELQYLDGKWYIYFAADDGNNDNHRLYVLENTSADPFSGTWVFKGQIADPTNLWAIDGTVLVVGSAKYFIWSGWEGATNVRQVLYIASMSNPWTISSNRVMISAPTLSWENNTSPQINEGPEVIIRGGVINLVYSASGSWTDTYCLGLLTASTSANLLNAGSWTKRGSPVFQSGNGLYGPGHASFTKSKDQTEDWIIYHTARWSGAGWNRQVRAQKFTWNADNTPNFGSPANPNSPILLPAGESLHTRYEAEAAVLMNGAATINDSSASGGVKAGYIDSASSYVEFTANVPSADTYIIAARTGNGTSGGADVWAVDSLSINGGAGSSFYVVNSGWDNWGIATAKVSLNAGNNTIRFTKITNYAEVDCIDLFPAQSVPPAPTATPTPSSIPTSTPTPTPVSGIVLSINGNVLTWTDSANGADYHVYKNGNWLAWTGSRTYTVSAVNGDTFYVTNGSGSVKSNTVTYGASNPTPTPSATLTATKTPTPTVTVTPTTTKTPTPSPTALPSVSPTASKTPTPTVTVTPTATTTPTPSGGAQPWAPNTAYKTGDLVTYGGHTYKCLQAHTSLVGWEPPNVPALWQLVS